MRKSRATAWSLTYFLAQKKLDGLLHYFKELGRMPRDLELNEDTLLNGFARAFDCVDGTKKVDTRKLSSLADQWYRYIETTPVEPELEAVHKLVQNKLQEAATKAKEHEGKHPKTGAGPAGRP